NPEKVLVMRGTLQPPVVTGVKRAGNTINSEFADKIGYIGQNLALIVYDLETCADMYSATLRAGTGACAVERQRGWENARPLHVYAGYQDVLIDELSDSVYLGCFWCHLADGLVCKKIGGVRSCVGEYAYIFGMKNIQAVLFDL